MDAALDFATANAVERDITEYLSAHPGTRQVMLIAHPINWIDATGVEAFGRLESLLASKRVALQLVGMKLPVETALRRAGHLKAHADLRLYRTETEALKACLALGDEMHEVSP